MELREVIQELNEQYFQQPLKDSYKRHLVIWHDPSEEFKDEIDQLTLEHVKVIQYDYHNAFKVRYLIDVLHATENILLYMPHAKDDSVSNPLIDMYLYSDFYLSDATAILLRTLELPDECRSTIVLYQEFLKNKRRREKFEKLVKAQGSQHTDVIHNSVIGTLLKCDADFDSILMTLIEAEATHQCEALLSELQKYQGDTYFSEMLTQRFGYVHETLNVREFLMTLVMTYLNETTTLMIPDSWESRLLLNRQNTRIFTEKLMKEKSDSFGVICESLYQTLQIESLLEISSIESVENCGLFKQFDEFILGKLIEELSADVYRLDAIEALVLKRQKLQHFEAYRHEYECVRSAAKVLAYRHLSPTDETESLFKRYVESDYLVDQAYRQFYTAYDELQFTDHFTALEQLVERVYVNGYMSQLSREWTAGFKAADMTWQIDNVNSQMSFFYDHMRPVGKQCKVVIISDGLRYEVADEFRERLMKRGMRGSNLHLKAIQSVIPSITELGMAALLPHSDDVVMDDSGTVLVKGQNSNGLTNRQAILGRVEGRVAYKYEDIIQLNSKEFKKLFTDQTVVYIYHNTIDAVGDHALSESSVFKAVEDTFEELEKLVWKFNTAKMPRVKQLYVTSDHGFLYQRSPLAEFDKLVREKQEVIREKRRYMLSKQPLDMDGTLTFDISDTVGNEMFVTVPNGQMRFKTQGAGANYVHGGAMPQEFVVPVLEYTVAEVVDLESVDVVCRNINKSIKNHVVDLTIMQSEVLTEDKVEQRCKIYFLDELENVLSNEALIIANSTSSNIDDRTWRQQLVIENRPYTKNEPLTLILENELTSERKEYVFYVDIVN